MQGSDSLYFKMNKDEKAKGEDVNYQNFNFVFKNKVTITNFVKTVLAEKNKMLKANFLYS